VRLLKEAVKICDGEGLWRAGLSVKSNAAHQRYELLAEGHSAEKLAALLNISARTVEFHKYRMMEVLGIKSAAELIRFAVRHGVSSQ
jgi:two-component system, NarL family, response regulator LiaR